MQIFKCRTELLSDAVKFINTLKARRYTIYNYQITCQGAPDVELTFACDIDEWQLVKIAASLPQCQTIAATLAHEDRYTGIEIDPLTRIHPDTAKPQLNGTSDTWFLND
jgi:hypothetical protein